MAMDVKEKFLFVWMLGAVIVTFVLRHFWDCLAYALEKCVASGLLSLPGIAKFAALICNVSVLP
jgi:hypothetical protein